MDIYLHRPREYYGEIGDYIGEGMYGQVYELPNDLCIKYGSFADLLNEMSALVRLQKCKHVVCMIDLGIIGNNAYIIMKRALSNLTKALIKDPLYVLYQLILGCLYLQTYGMIHQDLNENNILFYDDDKIKIADLGFFVIRNCNDKFGFQQILGFNFLIDLPDLHTKIAKEIMDKSFIEALCSPLFEHYKKGIIH